MSVTEIIQNVNEALIRSGLVMVEVSARHVHLDKETVEKLFGKDYKLTKKRELSQPGQYLCEERVNLYGTKGKFLNVAVLGPERNHSQVELSISDAITLGLKLPIRESGQTEGTPGITIESNNTKIDIPLGAIVAKRHIHVTPDIAEKLGVTDNQNVSVRLLTERSVILEDVVIRVSDKFRFRMHIDFDEANAAAVSGFVLGQILL